MRNYVDIGNARLKEQTKLMKKIISNGEDPFSKENISKYHSKPIIKEGNYWFLTENKFPYKNSRVQILAIHKQYAENLTELSSTAFSELLQLMKWAIKKYKIKGGALAMRFGETKYSGATIKHLHAQLIESDIKKKNFEPIKFYIGAKIKKSGI